MRFCSFLLLLTIVIGCSKKNTERTNFAEVTIDGHRFVFNRLEAIFDTSTQEITCNVSLYDTISNSNMIWETAKTSKWINGIYEYPGEIFPGTSVVYFDVQTYFNGLPGTYNMQGGNHLTLNIDQSENGRIHGTFSGKINCYTCNPGIEVPITNGEFEMPYSYR